MTDVTDMTDMTDVLQTRLQDVSETLVKKNAMYTSKMAEGESSKKVYLHGTRQLIYVTVFILGTLSIVSVHIVA